MGKTIETTQFLDSIGIFIEKSYQHEITDCLLKMATYIIEQRGKGQGKKGVINESGEGEGKAGNLRRIPYWDYLSNIDIPENICGENRGINLRDFCTTSDDRRLKNIISEIDYFTRLCIDHEHEYTLRMQDLGTFLRDIDIILKQQNQRVRKDLSRPQPTHTISDVKKYLPSTVYTEKELHSFVSGFCMLCHRTNTFGSLYCDPHQGNADLRSLDQELLNRKFSKFIELPFIEWPIAYKHSDIKKPLKAKSFYLFNWASIHPSHIKFTEDLSQAIKDICSNGPILETVDDWRRVAELLNHLARNLGKHEHFEKLDQKSLIDPNITKTEIIFQSCKFLDMDKIANLKIKDFFNLILRYSKYNIWKNLNK